MQNSKFENTLSNSVKCYMLSVEEIHPADVYQLDNVALNTNVPSTCQRGINI